MFTRFGEESSCNNAGLGASQVLVALSLARTSDQAGFVWSWRGTELQGQVGVTG
jgi:hypothetical protein